MTNSEFLKLADDLLHYNPRVNRATIQMFLKRVKSSPEALEKARALFGDRGVYYADMKDLGRFIADTVSSKELDKSKYQDYSKYKK